MFVISVAAMFLALHAGLTSGWSPLSGWKGTVGNVLLLVQFAAGHSILLADRGRKWMMRLAPFRLGRPLSTTLFATISSFQLLLVFVFWSPSRTLWTVPEGWPLHAMDGLYVLSWILLAKSMYDAGMDVQIGLLGWRSIWRNEPPVYKPFARTGTFRIVRQPIYLAFTLILWTAPIWTPDHLMAALLWTGYCIAAPVLKEKRYVRYYGDAFLRYKERVPYWNPFSHSKDRVPSGTKHGTDYDVVIIGAGPVGLLLANLLADRGLRVHAIEQSEESSMPSQAIGITPPSLEILSRLGLAASVIEYGLPIRKVMVHGELGPAGICDLSNLPGDHRFVLSAPQYAVMELLRRNLKHYPNASLQKGTHAKILLQDGGGVEVDIAHAGMIHPQTVRALHVVACDGSHGKTRDHLRIRSHGGMYGCHFAMADFLDRSRLGTEAHLFFTAEGAVESFPLPGGHRRWVVQIPDRHSCSEIGAATIADIVFHRTGLSLMADKDEAPQVSVFSPRWMRCETFVDGRIFLCGDVAHVMSPIGGQGMNTGFADAEFLGVALPAMQRNPHTAATWSAAYDQVRSRAARVATHRAAWGMRLGTLRGRSSAILREAFMRWVLFSPLLASHLANWFSMNSIPGATLSRVPKNKLPSAYSRRS
ncbi:FAD-dependent monooxygenase [Roseimicrobium gellanilyticum]|nr:FAD-dependent monooxygenase [Roseimicrobium gellanilyticum]